MVKAYKKNKENNPLFPNSISPRGSDFFLLAELAKSGCAEKAGYVISKTERISLTRIIAVPGKEHADGFRFINHVIGRTVSSLVNDTSLDEKLRAFIRKENKRKLDLFQKCLEERLEGKLDRFRMRQYVGVDPIFDLPYLYMQIRLSPTPESFLWQDLFIKADGIIVHPVTLEFYLVDAA